ncbi:MAG: glycosyltransferase family 4 protein [Bacillota bacterium]
MRILMYARPGLGSLLAGDAVQARATAAALRRLGVEVDLAEDRLPDLGSYDLVHLFNLIPIDSTHAAYRAVRTAGKPFVLSPVFWDPTEYLVRTGLSSLLAWWERTMPLRAEVLRAAALILPNGQGELECLRRFFRDLPPHLVVPNGVDPAFFYPLGAEDRREGPLVLCVGRISPRKNQLGVIHALRDTGTRVLFIGPVNDFAYYRTCRTAAGSGMSFREAVSGRRLAALYRAARVHVLASWYETPGLASLEAAACGCRVVTTDRGTAREYFGERAWYCPPDDPDAIREAVLAALAAPCPRDLAATVRTRYTWAEAARVTKEGYEFVLRRVR